MMKMLRRFSKLIKLLFDLKGLRALAAFRFNGFLLESGWFNSFFSQSSVDACNEPLPWLTYPFLRFIEGRLSKKFDIFEFGSGNSTLYFASKVKSVTTVEHDKTWYEKLYKQLPANVKLMHIELVTNGAYSHAAVDSKISYDLILVDGRDRVNSVKNSFIALKDEGVLVLDDVERSEYQEAIMFLEEKNFKRLDFWGISPGIPDEKCTTIFYRHENCLNI